MRVPTAIVLGLSSCLLFAAGRARANGAFPDSLQILAPADRPHEIVLSTNFGVIISEDDGASWLWSCEQPTTNLAALYQMGAPPLDRLFAVSTAGLVYSDDGACTWNSAGGSLATATASDAFPDPTDATRVLAIATPVGAAASVYRSADSGGSFGPPLLSAMPAGGLLGVESAASAPLTVYVAAYEPPDLRPRLGRSTDGGATWTMLDLQPFLGNNQFRIVAVDRQDPGRLFLRVLEPGGESLAVSRDGGETFTSAVDVDGNLTAFVRLASGTVLVGGIVNSQGVAFRSTDGGDTFEEVPGPPRLRALAERDGRLYAATDNFRDGFAVAVSDDEGKTFRPLLRYDQVAGVKPCVAAACAESCRREAAVGLWPAEICPAATGGIDGGATPDGGTTPEANAAGAGGCAVASAAADTTQAPALLLVAAAIAVAGVLSARRRRPRCLPDRGR